MPAPFSSAALKLAATGRLDLAWPQLPSGHRGDYDLNANWSQQQDPSRLRPAAVLIPVVDLGDAAEARVVLTHRTDHLPSHAGQVAFPGGKIEPQDESPVAAALREAEEEIGLDRAAVTPLGYLDPYITSSGFNIQPVLALVRPEATFHPDPNEVAEVFDVPLGFLMTPGNHQIGTREWRGAERRYYAMPYDRHYIWGVTAGIIRLMYERLFREC